MVPNGIDTAGEPGTGACRRLSWVLMEALCDLDIRISVRTAMEEYGEFREYIPIYQLRAMIWHMTV